VIIFESDRLFVRRYTLQDEEMFFQLNSDPELMRYIRPPKTRAESKAFLQENMVFYDQRPCLGRWALLEKATNKVVGTCSLLPLEHTSDVHIGYALMKDQWGKSYASEIVKAGINYAFGELKLPSVVAVTYADNMPSQKVLTRNNFVLDGFYKENGLEKLLFRLSGNTQRRLPDML
jgi:[ribosomal protein S5]-alanine N-acetyltransferase